MTQSCCFISSCKSYLYEANTVLGYVMTAVRFLSLLSACALASCSFGGGSRGPSAPAYTQEFNPNTSSWETSTRVVVPPPSQPATPYVAPAGSQPAVEQQQEKPGLLKRSFKWLPGV